MTVFRPLTYLLLAVPLLAISIYLRSRSETQEPDRIIAKIEQNIERELTRLDRDARLIKKFILENQEWPVVPGLFYLHDSLGIVKKWNTHVFLPEPSVLLTDSIVYQQSGQGYYLLKQYVLPGEEYLTGYIRLQSGYPIQNKYLSSSLNKSVFPAKGISFDLSKNVHTVKLRGKNLFSLSINTSVAVSRPWEVWSWILFSLGMLFLSLFTWKTVRSMTDKRKYWLAAISVFLFFYGVRLLMVYGNFPGTNTDDLIFDPKQFASSTFNDSIGNLLINSIAFFITSIAAYSLLRQATFINWRNRTIAIKTAAVTFFIIVCYSWQVLPFLYIETIYDNSAISPDISSQLYFDDVRWCALLCVILSSLTGFYYFFTFFRCAIRISLSNGFIFGTALFLGTIAFFLFHVFNGTDFEVPIAFTFIHLIILFFSSVTRKLKFISSRIFSLILLALIIFSLQTSLAIRMMSMERQQKSMFKFGNSFLIEHDILGEYLLDKAISRIESDAFIQQQMINPFNRLNSVVQKIKHNHLYSYFDRYETRIYLFDNRGQPVNNDFTTDLTSLIKGFVPLAEGTGYRGIYIINNPSDQFLKRYLAVVPIKFYVTGYIVLDLTLKQVIPVTVFPKLLLESRFSDYANSSHYSFAIFNKGKLMNSVGRFAYQSSNLRQNLINPKLFREGIVEDGFYHVGIEDLNGYVAVVSSEKYSAFNVMTNFAFCFLVGFILVLTAFALLNIEALSRRRLTYSDRIQLYVYLAVVLPLLVIAITSLRINSVSDEKKLENESADKANRLSHSIVSVLNGTSEDLQNELTIQAQGTGVDMTIFSNKGLLVASSQPGIFSNQLVSRFINPEALRKISKGNFLFTLNDKIGKLKFRNTYSAIRSPLTGEVRAILSIPFFESLESTERGQIELVSNILSVFVIVFLLFYVISFIALNWLTEPLRVIAGYLQRTTFSGSNKKLTWNSKDEIGSMVKEYNRMIDNLDRSRQELAQKQREMAWREMARQVAHEIKNPLTPIKLTLQRMEQSLKEGTVDKESTVQSIKSVLHHVDILNEIASSFSAFAQMPELKLEQTNIIELLNETVSLFSDPNEGKTVFKGKGRVEVMADKKLFSRIFSNIILNALQSKKENNLVTVNVEAQIKSGNCLITFSDNGQGISHEIIDKIFIPYFSTKETGSGLGLAIAKQGIEQAGGKIWCQSNPGQGSCFYISLPVL